MKSFGLGLMAFLFSSLPLITTAHAQNDNYFYTAYEEPEALTQKSVRILGSGMTIEKGQSIALACVGDADENRSGCDRIRFLYINQPTISRFHPYLYVGSPHTHYPSKYSDHGIHIDGDQPFLYSYAFYINDSEEYLEQNVNHILEILREAIKVSTENDTLFIPATTGKVTQMTTQSGWSWSSTPQKVSKNYTALFPAFTRSGLLDDYVLSSNEQSIATTIQRFELRYITEGPWAGYYSGL